jgi:hypothetical protein
VLSEEKKLRRFERCSGEPQRIEFTRRLCRGDAGADASSLPSFGACGVASHKIHRARTASTGGSRLRNDWFA